MEGLLGGILMMTSVLIACFSQILLKSAAVKKNVSFLKKLLNWKVLVSYGMFFGSTIFSTLALRHMELKYSPLFQSTSFIWILLLSWIFFREKPQKKQILGVICIAAGIIIFSFQPQQTEQKEEPLPISTELTKETTGDRAQLSEDMEDESMSLPKETR